MKKIIILLIIAIGHFSLGYVICRDKLKAEQEVFNKTHEIFCKECCWNWSPTMKDGGEIDVIYTCSKDKNRLWRKIN